MIASGTAVWLKLLYWAKIDFASPIVSRHIRNIGEIFGLKSVIAMAYKVLSRYFLTPSPNINRTKAILRSTTQRR